MLQKQDSSDSSNLEFVAFLLGEQSFCIEITQIREIRRWSPVTILPHSPRHVMGVINLRGAVIPILDLAAILGFDSIEPSERHVIIIVQIGEQICGLLVDSVSEILSVRPDVVQDTPSLSHERGEQSIQGVIATEMGMTRLINLDLISAIPGNEAA